MQMIYFLNAISLTIFQIGSYFIWFSKKNVFNHLAIGFCIVAYFIPTFIFDFELYASKEIINLYILINLVGAIFFVIGLLVGNKWKQLALIDSVLKFSIIKQSIGTDEFGKTLVFLSRKIYLICLIVMVLCFMYMGFLPMFAADPYSAKQFKGIYQIRYQHIAFFYRTAKVYVQFLLPIMILLFFKKKKIVTLLLIFLGFSLVIVTMSRAEMFTGLLMILSIIVVMRAKNTVFIFYIISLIFIYSVGSGLWTILAILFPGSSFNNFVNGYDINIAQAISFGAPDIADQLNLLDAFMRNKVNFTYGLTFIGGLIPYNFPWNPSVWTLTVVNNTNDISDIASGGLRAPISMWGYFSFGWVGVLIVPFLSGFFSGYIIKKFKNIISKITNDFNGYLLFYFIVFMYLNLAYIFTDFYRLSIYTLPPFIFFFLLLYFYNNKKHSFSIGGVFSNVNKA